MLRIKLIIKYCVSCWITVTLQNETRSIQYQILRTVCHITGCPATCNARNFVRVAQSVQKQDCQWTTEADRDKGFFSLPKPPNRRRGLGRSSGCKTAGSWSLTFTFISCRDLGWKGQWRCIPYDLMVYTVATLFSCYKILKHWLKHKTVYTSIDLWGIANNTWYQAS